MTTMPIKAKSSESLATQNENASPASYLLEFVVAGLPKLPNGSHGHWRVMAAHKKEWKKKAFAACWHKRPPKPLEFAHATFTRHSSVEPDDDNLTSSFKAVRDGLKQSGIIVDDKSKHLKSTYLWVKAAPKAGFISVKVEGI